MKKCSFCKKEIKPGTGKMFVKKDGKLFYFCSRKCEMHALKLKRKPANMTWLTKKSKKKTGDKK
ncbi:50S ribosomal protein L24e [Candidatus Woesearchaeota archaeon]|nr:50S ribosomal protein L24e [Candidatus Woesearchaeota archaeon]